MTESSKCKTAKGLLNRLDNLMFVEPSKQILKCRKCGNMVMVSDWYNGKSFKELLDMTPECEECHVRFT